jgi:hypothetical protein
MTWSSPALPDLRPLRERLADLRLEHAATLEEATERLDAAQLTDGLPVVPPTEARIAAVLDGRDGSAPVAGPIPPAFATPTLWDVAASLVMAGGRPEYLPVLMAALEALTDPAFNLLGIQTTTGSATPMLIVHGPLARRLHINAGANCLGPGSRANATIGRALRLVLQNIGAALPGIGDMATLGQPGKYTWCFAENEAESPWESFHTTRGLPASASAVTVVGAGGSLEAVLTADSPEALVARLSAPLRAGGLGGDSGGREVVLVLPPESARLLRGHGWDRTRLAAELARCVAGADADSILIVVAGGAGVKAAVVQTWSSATRAITRAIDAP